MREYSTDPLYVKLSRNADYSATYVGRAVFLIIVYADHLGAKLEQKQTGLTNSENT